MPDDSIARSAKVVWGLEKNGVLPETGPTAAEEESSSIYTPSSLPTLLPTSTADSFSTDVDLDDLVQPLSHVLAPVAPLVATSPATFPISDASTPILTPQSTPTLQGSTPTLQADPLYPHHPYVVPRESLSPDPLSLFALVA